MNERRVLYVDAAVVGSGVAGATAAQGLAEACPSVCVLDKGRGPGGRSATRRHDAVQFDHGAQYFTARSTPFRQFVAEMAAAGVVARWEAPIVAYEAPERCERVSSTVRFVGVPGMNALASALGRGLDRRFSERVERLERTDSGRWQLVTQNGLIVNAGSVVLTAPPPQSAALVERVDARLARRVADVDVSPVWAVMVELERPLAASFGGAFVNTGPLAWIAHDSTKPGRRTRDCWVLHASTEWSKAQVDARPEDVVARLLDAFATVLGERIDVARAIAQRWLYAQPTQPLTGSEAMVHTAGYLICASFFLPQVLSIAMIALGQRHQSLPDIILGTAAINRPR